jgi:hypothetical protein
MWKTVLKKGTVLSSKSSRRHTCSAVLKDVKYIPLVTPKQLEGED